MINYDDLQAEKSDFGAAHTKLKDITDVDAAFAEIAKIDAADAQAKADAELRNKRTKEILDAKLSANATARDFWQHQIAAYAINNGLTSLDSLSGTYKQRKVSASLKVADKDKLLEYAKDAEWTDAITETVNATKLKSMAGLSITSDGRVVDANGMVLPDGAYDVTPAHTSVSFKTEVK